jgi:hypothetical protein
MDAASDIIISLFPCRLAENEMSVTVAARERDASWAVSRY